MSEKKIIDLGQYRKKKKGNKQRIKPLPDKLLSFDEELQEFIHRPFGDPGSKNELLTIFEKKLVKKEIDDEKEETD